MPSLQKANYTANTGTRHRERAILSSTSNTTLPPGNDGILFNYTYCLSWLPIISAGLSMFVIHQSLALNILPSLLLRYKTTTKTLCDALCEVGSKWTLERTTTKPRPLNFCISSSVSCPPPAKMPLFFGIYRINLAIILGFTVINANHYTEEQLK